MILLIQKGKGQGSFSPVVIIVSFDSFGSTYKSQNTGTCIFDRNVVYRDHIF